MNIYAWAVVNIQQSDDKRYVNIDAVFKHKYQAKEYVKLHEGAWYNRNSEFFVTLCPAPDWLT